MVMLSK